MINEITKSRENLLNFIKYASQFYKAKYFNFENVLYLYDVCPNGQAFGLYEDWNGIGRRIIGGQHGYRLQGENNWTYVVFDYNQTWGTPIKFHKFDKDKMKSVVNNLIEIYKLNDFNKISEDKSSFFNTIYDISIKNIERKNYDFDNSEKNFVSTITALLTLSKCDYDITDLMPYGIMQNIKQNNYSYLLDTSYYFYRNIMFEINNLERKIKPLEKNNDITKPKDENQNKEEKEYKEDGNHTLLQPSLFSIEETTNHKELINVLKKGDPYQSSGRTIYRIITNNSKEQAIKELKDRFGVYGYSYDFINGIAGQVNYNGNGLVISDSEDNELKYNWNTIYDTYKQLIANKEYPDKDIMEHLEELESNKDTIINNEYNIKDLQQCENLLEYLVDRYPDKTELVDMYKKVSEDNRYVEKYYETYEDIQETISLFDYLKEQDSLVNRYINDYLDTNNEIVYKNEEINELFDSIN